MKKKNNQKEILCFAGSSTCQREADAQMNTSPKRVFMKVSNPDNTIIKNFLQSIPIGTRQIQTL